VSAIPRLKKFRKAAKRRDVPTCDMRSDLQLISALVNRLKLFD
jgi:hypothetical protein